MDITFMFTLNHWNDRFFKIVSIIGFFLILVILSIILSIGPAISYEFSIYDAYPWYFWVFILSAIMCGEVVIIGSAITHSKKKYCLFGLCTILISNIILLFIPLIRGYYSFDEGDVLTHVGYMQDILRTSNIGVDNNYPLDHINGVIIHLMSGLSLPDITLFIPQFFSFFFILSMYLVGKTIYKNKFELWILVLISSILTFGSIHSSFKPNFQAIFIVPLVLYLAFKMYHSIDYKKYNILLMLVGFSIVFFHPLVTIMVILLLCLMQIMQYILERYENKILKKVNYTYAIFLMVIAFSLWSTYLRDAVYVSTPIFNRIFGMERIESELLQSTNLISQVNIDLSYLLKLLFNIYGQWILLTILALLSIVFIFKSMKKQDTLFNFYKVISVIGFYVFLIFSLFMLFFNAKFEFIRVYSFTVIFSLIVIPPGVYLFLCNTTNDKSLSRKTIIKLLGVILIFFCITFFSTFNLYWSPIVKQANQQVPKSDYIGMSTFFSYWDESLPVLELGPTSYRFYDAIYGYAAKINVKYIDARETNIPPDHFGYQNETASRSFFNNSKYFLLNYRGREFWPIMYPEFKNNWRFVAKDFEQLKFDSKVQQIYSNRNLEIYLLSGKQTEYVK